MSMCGATALFPGGLAQLGRCACAAPYAAFPPPTPRELQASRRSPPRPAGCGPARPLGLGGLGVSVGEGDLRNH